MTELEHSLIRGRTEAMRMVLLTFCTIGITFTWGIEMTYCTPYLLDLGLSKSNTSLVWVAGPLSGLIVQPVVGVLSDESTSPWGRRRPIMVIGAAVVAVSLLVLGFTKQLVHSVFGETASPKAIIVVAVMAIYVVDFAINAVMSCSRSLIVDTLPIEKQQAGAAWASRMSAIGHMIGYSAGAIDMVGTFGTTLGDTQFQQLTIIAAAAIIVSTAVTCWAVSEKAFTADKALQPSGSGFKIFSQIYERLIHLPPRVQAICWAQFWSWIGWFPFLFYSTTWVGETYFRYDVAADKKSDDVLGQIGRVGSTSFVIYSTITLLGALFLPLVVRAPDEQSYTRRLPSGFLGKLVARMKWDKPDLLSTWIFGHLVFAGAMLLSPFATSFRFATVLVCLCGLPWTIAMWAPTALLGVEVNKMAAGHSYQQVGHEMIDREAPRQDAQADMELSGVYFGILNIYTTLPQFIGTFISSIVFSVLEPGKNDNNEGGQFAVENATGPNAISICLFIGALSSIGAGYATKRLKALYDPISPFPMQVHET